MCVGGESLPLTAGVVSRGAPCLADSSNTLVSSERVSHQSDATPTLETHARSVCPAPPGLPPPAFRRYQKGMHAVETIAGCRVSAVGTYTFIPGMIYQEISLPFVVCSFCCVLVPGTLGVLMLSRKNGSIRRQHTQQYYQNLYPLPGCQVCLLSSFSLLLTSPTYGRWCHQVRIRGTGVVPCRKRPKVSRGLHCRPPFPNRDRLPTAKHRCRSLTLLTTRVLTCTRELAGNDEWGATAKSSTEAKQQQQQQQPHITRESPQPFRRGAGTLRMSSTRGKNPTSAIVRCLVLKLLPEDSSSW